MTLNKKHWEKAYDEANEEHKNTFFKRLFRSDLDKVAFLSGYNQGMEAVLKEWRESGRLIKEENERGDYT